MTLDFYGHLETIFIIIRFRWDYFFSYITSSSDVIAL